MIKDFIVGTKFVLSFAISLSALFAYIMAKGEIHLEMFTAAFAVLLVAMGVSTINQVQEYKEDSQMERTKHRPIASGKWSPTTGMMVAGVLIVLALILIYDLLGLSGLNLFLFSFIWYNGVYTPLKKKSAFAVIPGALLGVVPPAIGWLAAGESLLQVHFYALGFFYFIWQVPHFWLLVMLHFGGYKDAGYPTVMKIFGEDGLKRMTFVWLLFTIQAGAYLVTIFDPKSAIIFYLLILIGIFAAYSSFQVLNKKFELLHARTVFWQINASFLGVIILLSADVMMHTQAGA